MTPGVVLGGGGIAGVAWEAGIVIGLRRAGGSIVGRGDRRYLGRVDRRPEADVSDIECFIAQAKIILPVLGSQHPPLAAWPTGLILTAQMDMDGELGPIRVGADAANSYGHPLSADQHHLCRDRPGAQA
jgi:hypothetical protein